MTDETEVEQTVKAMSLAGFGSGHTWSAQDLGKHGLPPEFIGRTVRETIEEADPQTRRGMVGWAEEYKRGKTATNGEAVNGRSDEPKTVLLFAVKGAFLVGAIRSTATPDTDAVEDLLTDIVCQAGTSLGATVNDEWRQDVFDRLADVVRQAQAFDARDNNPQGPAEAPTLDTGSPVQ